MNYIRRGISWVKENISVILVIIAILLAFSMTVFLAFGPYYNDAKKNAVTIGSMTVAQEAKKIEDAMSTDIKALLLASYTVDSMIERGASTEEIEQYFVQETQGFITGINPDFSGFYGVVNDVYIDGIGWVPEEGYDPYDRPWYTAAAEKNGELAIVTPYVDAQTGSIMLSFSKLLMDGKSAISLDTTLDIVREVTDTIQLNGSGYCFLVDRSGNVIAHRDEKEVGKNYLTDSLYNGTVERRLINEVLSSPKEGTISGTEIIHNIKLYGRNSMVFTKNVIDEWYVVLVVDSVDVFHNTRVYLTYSIVASLVIFIVVGYFCASNYVHRKRAIKYAEHIRIDDLTGLNNRGEFDRYLYRTVNEDSFERKLYLLLFDADKFKSINDTYGHPEGDRALQFVATALKKVCHGTDYFCARYGGDEFVIICKSNDEEAVKKIISDVAEQLRKTTADNKLPYELSLSCGYACYDYSLESTTELIDIADRNLYSAKAKNRYNDNIMA